MTKLHIAMQVAPSFKALVQRNTDLCLQFIKEVSLRLAIPSIPEPNDPDGTPLSEDPDSDDARADYCSMGSPAPSGASSTASEGERASAIPSMGPPTPPREEAGSSKAGTAGIVYSADVESPGSPAPVNNARVPGSRPQPGGQRRL